MPDIREPLPRIKVFVDYWNFQLSLNSLEAADRKLDDYRFPIDWQKLGNWLARNSCTVVGIDPVHHTYEGVIIYSSFNPRTAEGKKFRAWATNWLDRQPGVDVKCFERVAKGLPKCPSCHREIGQCPHCQDDIKATTEKGVDTMIATDMIRLAWEEAYDIAVLASSDSDLVPAVAFLNEKGRKVVQAGFPPRGVELATACWGSFDVYPKRKEIERPPRQ
jgi:uncharacterized LabA/DUF88 family protein